MCPKHFCTVQFIQCIECFTYLTRPFLMPSVFVSMSSCACGRMLVCANLLYSVCNCFLNLSNEIHPNAGNKNVMLGKSMRKTSCNSNETISPQSLRQGKKAESSMESSRCSSPSAPVQVGGFQHCCPLVLVLVWSSVPVLCDAHVLSNTHTISCHFRGGKLKPGQYFPCGFLFGFFFSLQAVGVSGCSCLCCFSALTLRILMCALASPMILKNTSDYRDR